jgi:hypothetical protein
MWWRQQKRWGLNDTVELLPEHNGSSCCSGRTTRQLAGGGDGVCGGGDSGVDEWEASIGRRLRLRGTRRIEKVERGGEWACAGCQGGSAREIWRGLECRYS